MCEGYRQGLLHELRGRVARGGCEEKQKKGERGKGREEERGWKEVWQGPLNMSLIAIPIFCALLRYFLQCPLLAE